MSIDPEPPADPAAASLPPELPAAAAALAGAHGHHGPFHTHCENCGEKLAGPFCHRCGQHDFEFHRSFRHVFLEALESFFHFEGKFFRNVVTLLFRPGRLTAGFNTGRRASQMPPFRLYVFVSFAFFFLVFLGGKPREPVIRFDDAAPGTAAAPAALQHALDEAAAGTAGNPAAQQVVGQIRRIANDTVATAAQAQAPDNRPLQFDGSENSAFLRWLEAQGVRAREPGFQDRMVDSFLHSIPRLLLVCLPLFALYTRFLFPKSGQVYLQHLVVALHFHTFVYLWVMFRDGWVFLARFVSPGLAGWLLFAGNLWIALYPLLMLRHLFGESWRRTLAKTVVLAVAYTATLGVGFAATVVVLLLLL